MIEQDFAGKRALVTGGTKGIGLATARLLNARGATVIVSARTPPSSTEAGTTFVAADLASADGPEVLAAAVLKEFGGVDVLINNAGSQRMRTRVEEFTDEDWLQELQLNLLASVKLDRALLPALTESRGSIVHISSTVARMPEPAVLPYAAAKAALAVYSKGLSKQAGADGIRVNSVFPGFTATEMFVEHFTETAAEQGNTFDEFVPSLMKQMGVALGRPGGPEEVAAAIVFLASPAASYITGTQTMVEGGTYPGVF